MGSLSPGDLYNMFEKGGFIAIAVVAIVAWWLERKENKRLVEQMLDLATASIEAQTENKALLQVLKDTLSQILGKL